MTTPFQDDDQLIRQFVESFYILDGTCRTDHKHPPPDELNAGLDPDDWAALLWRPAPITTETTALASVYHLLPSRFPPLYERLVLSWRWLKVCLHKIRLFANPPGSDLRGLANNVLRDPVFAGHLIGSGYLPFGLDINIYDPVCFDTNHRRDDGDCPIRMFEHEAMLSFDRIGESQLLWPSFRNLMIETIEVAAARQ